ncbi:MAG: nitroreductase [Chitinophagales bacterium]|nr:nitroreductase [Bacteroidota bacterium]MCB9257173.1 nitroreductase [Chitinophagales bacterium]
MNKRNDLLVDYVIENIKNRRTIKPDACNGAMIPDEEIWQILECANWAPTHGYTEPWRFIVYKGKSKEDFALAHAEMYKAASTEDSFKQVAYDKLINNAKGCSHIIALVNKRGTNPKIPEIEELQATAMAIQNMQLVASAMGYAAYIHSGGMTYKEEMRAYLGFEQEDKVLGFLYLGIPVLEQAPGRRVSNIQEKVLWKS